MIRTRRIPAALFHNPLHILPPFARITVMIAGLLPVLGGAQSNIIHFTLSPTEIWPPLSPVPPLPDVDERRDGGEGGGGGG